MYTLIIIADRVLSYDSLMKSTPFGRKREKAEPLPDGWRRGAMRGPMEAAAVTAQG